VHYVRVVDEEVRAGPGRSMIRSLRSRLAIGSIAVVAVVAVLGVSVWCVTSSIAAPGDTWTPQTAAAPGFWYWCDDYQQYYPYVGACPSPWRAVPPG